MGRALGARRVGRKAVDKVDKVAQRLLNPKKVKPDVERVKVMAAQLVVDDMVRLPSGPGRVKAVGADFVLIRKVFGVGEERVSPDAVVIRVRKLEPQVPSVFSEVPAVPDGELPVKRPEGRPKGFPDSRKKPPDQGERVKAGLARAKSRGVRLGRPPKGRQEVV